MRQRMTDEEWADRVSQVGLGRRVEILMCEAESARAEEARLLAEVSEKDAMIALLAERLAQHGEVSPLDGAWHHKSCIVAEHEAHDLSECDYDQDALVKAAKFFCQECGAVGQHKMQCGSRG